MSENHGGLRRELSGRQVGMIALGGTIGTGLFLGSGLAISLAGPAVILAYLLAALLALCLSYALAEMVVVNPDAGGFGGLAQRYLGPMAGFVMRWTYWAAMVVNLGSEVIAAGLYVRFWWPQVPLWLPVVVFSVLMLAINAASVRWFGEFEYWFAMIKVVTIVVFVLIGLTYVFVGLPDRPAVGLTGLGADGGFAPNGLGSVWLALTVVTFSYIGTESVSVVAAEARDPARDVPRAARGIVVRLLLFYVLATFVVVAIVPWRQAASAEGVAQSPFVRLFSIAGVPAAAGVMNFVVLTAALSAMNTNLYLNARTAHSLARDGFAPAWLGRVSRQGSPRNALALSAAGLALAAALSVFSPEQAFPIMLGIALFGALGIWMMIFVSHLAFRRQRAGQPASPVRLPGAPVTSVLAVVLLGAVLVTTAFTRQFATAWQVGVPFTVVLVVAYLITRAARRHR